MAITSSKKEALDLLEQVRREYVEAARDAAVRLHLSTGRPITVNDVRQVCPPPDGIDGRVMGAVLRAPTWIKAGYVMSDRRMCHNRPISQFVLAEEYRNRPMRKAEMPAKQDLTLFDLLDGNKG